LRIPSRTQTFDYISADLSTVSGIKSAIASLKDRCSPSQSIDYLFQTQGGPPNGSWSTNPEGHETRFVVQVLSKFAISEALAREGLLKRASLIVCAPGGSQTEFDPDTEIECEHYRDSNALSLLMAMGKRDGIVTDSFTKVGCSGLQMSSSGRCRTALLPTRCADYNSLPSASFDFHPSFISLVHLSSSCLLLGSSLCAQRRFRCHDLAGTFLSGSSDGIRPPILSRNFSPLPFPIFPACRGSPIFSLLQYLQSKYPGINFYHVFPGIVTTSSAANSGFPFPIPQLFSLASPFISRTIGNSPESYAEVPVCIATNDKQPKGDDGEIQMQIQGRFLDQRMKSIKTSPWSDKPENQEKVFNKLMSYLS
jgi:hypothetical protein